MHDWTKLEGHSVWYVEVLREDPKVELKLYPDGSTAGMRIGTRYTVNGTLAEISYALGMLSRGRRDYGRTAWTCLASLQAIVSHERKRLHGNETDLTDSWESEG